MVQTSNEKQNNIIQNSIPTSFCTSCQSHFKIISLLQFYMNIQLIRMLYSISFVHNNYGPIVAKIDLQTQCGTDQTSTAVAHHRFMPLVEPLLLCPAAQLLRPTRQHY